MSKLAKLKAVLKKDPQWLTFRRITKHSLDPQFDTWTKEVMTLHKNRGVRILSSKSGSRKLSDAALQDQSYRSRCVEIVMQLSYARNNLAMSLVAIVKYMQTEYQTEFANAGLRTKTSQNAACDLLTSRASDTLDKIDSMIEIIDMVIADVDKASYALKLAMSALEIATQRGFAK